MESFAEKIVCHPEERSGEGSPFTRVLAGFLAARSLYELPSGRIPSPGEQILRRCAPRDDITLRCSGCRAVIREPLCSSAPLCGKAVAAVESSSRQTRYLDIKILDAKLLPMTRQPTGAHTWLLLSRAARAVQ